MTYKEFMKQVDREVEKITGFGSGDFADFVFLSVYESGMTPKETAREMLEADDVGCQMLELYDE